MAKITKMPSLKIIRGFRGVLDYYYNMGIPCVRKWPDSPGKNRNPNVRAWWVPFSQAQKDWSLATPIVKDAYARMVAGTPLTARDLFTKGYISGLYRLPPP